MKMVQERVRKVQDVENRYCRGDYGLLG